LIRDKGVFVCALVLFVTSGYFAHAQTSAAICPRPAAGATIENPPELRSQNGKLELGLHLRYQQTMIGEGPPRYCYITDDGVESPTLRVHPGDRLIIHLHNDLSKWQGYQPPVHNMPTDDPDCAPISMDPSVTNLHFHGMTIPAVCHQDEVIHTAVAAGKEFDYRITIPANEPPGLYWYHPHAHGFSERQVQGGASGALMVEGIEQVDRTLASMRERVLVLRDEQFIGVEVPGPSVPSWDLSANFVPVEYSHGRPAKLVMKPEAKEFWRVLNAGADTIFKLQVMSDGTAQAIRVVAIDGVPVDKKGATQDSIVLPPGARTEFVVTAPKKGKSGLLITRAWDTGPQGDNDIERTIAEIETSPAGDQDVRSAAVARSSPPVKTKTLVFPTDVVSRRLYFSQISSNSVDPDNFVQYFVTVVGQNPVAYSMDAPPNIVIHQGDVEDWTIENRAPEDHVFHIHQVHFRVLAIDGKSVSDPTMRDTIDVPYWKGEGPYPSVTLRMDFTSPNTLGTFLYHCHILKHEDVGMMGSIQVLPPGVRTSTTLSAPRKVLEAGSPLTVRAAVTPATASGKMQFVVDDIDNGRTVAVKDGVAEFTTSFMDAGPHTITANYSGDQKHDESAARPIIVTVR
jgi:FtsP/CotA-like multicopper oxidase with cupredoxin domain